MPYPWLISLLPRNIRTLQISEGTDLTEIFIKNLCRAKQGKKSLLFLSRIEVFSSFPYEFMVLDTASLSLACSNANLSLSLYFPGFHITSPDVDRSLWSLKNEGLMTQVGWEKFSREDPCASGVAPYDWARLSVMAARGLNPLADRQIDLDAEGDVEMIDGN